MVNIPLSLYIHFPWCIQKCPYCDFNSHNANYENYELYIDCLIEDLKNDIPFVQGRSLSSIFIGGGTPSLIPPNLLDKLFNQISLIFNLSNIEITLESNPNSSDYKKFLDYKKIGVNRLSIGIQSFDDILLKKIGRIHDENDATNAIKSAYKAGFERVNIDLMFALPDQNINMVLEDLSKAFQFNTSHLSWYQLTIESNTVFYKKTPKNLPIEDDLFEMNNVGLEFLQQKYQRYEISAFSQNDNCLHNVNYWTFGDYLGIGAGAHSKITYQNQVMRMSKKKVPEKYMKKFLSEKNILNEDELPFEFMLNTLRLVDGFDLSLFQERLNLNPKIVYDDLQIALTKGLITLSDNFVKPTERGLWFLNDIICLFLKK